MSDSLQTHEKDIHLIMRRLWGVIAASALIVGVWQACVGYGLRSLLLPVLMLALGAVTHLCLGAMIVLICEHFVVFGGLGVALSRIIREVPVEEEPVIADAD